MNDIKTLDDAMKYRYASWSGNEKGLPYSPERCAGEVHDNYRFYQCSRKNGHGLNNLFCKQHAKKMQ